MAIDSVVLTEGTAVGSAFYFFGIINIVCEIIAWLSVVSVSVILAS